MRSATATALPLRRCQEMPAIAGGLAPSRLVSLGIFVTLVWKLKTFRWLLVVYQNVPLVDPFFPQFFRSEWTLALAYGLAAGFALWGVIGHDRLLLRWQTTGLCAALATLCVHQGSYNDVTFCTACWCSAWCWWYVRRVEHESAETLQPKAAFLAHAIIAVILLGGAMGKLTPGYWSGAVLYDIYFVDRDYWVFNWLRTTFDGTQLRNIAAWYSRFVIATELTGAALLVTLPAMWASWTAIAIFSGIALASNLSLFSVVTCLIALAAVGLLRTPQ